MQVSILWTGTSSLLPVEDSTNADVYARRFDIEMVPFIGRLLQAEQVYLQGNSASHAKGDSLKCFLNKNAGVLLSRVNPPDINIIENW